MNTQPEQILENNLIRQLTQLGYGFVTIKDESDLLHNLKGQLEKHNKATLSDKEFAQVIKAKKSTQAAAQADLTIIPDNITPEDIYEERNAVRKQKVQ